jgi:hypothetical protein
VTGSASEARLATRIGTRVCVRACVQKPAMALYLNVVKGGFNQGADKSTRNRTRHFRRAYRPTRDFINVLS